MEHLFIGNNLAVDFVNTQAGTPKTWVDQLADFRDLKNWLTSANFGGDIKCTPIEVRNVLNLRRNLKRIFEKIISKSFIDSIELTALNQCSNKLTHRISVEAEGFKFTPVIETGDDALAQIARSACELLASDKIKRLRQCESVNCSFFFLDTSKGQNRLWCSMDTCGNRSKAQRSQRRSKCHEGVSDAS